MLTPDEYANLDPAFAENVKRLKAAVGGDLSVYSGYRTPERQAQLFAAEVSKRGSEQAARKYVAPPGKSQHNSGTAADLRGNLAAAHQLAAQFGLTFPMSYEPWHIEPIGARKGVANVGKQRSYVMPPNPNSRNPGANLGNLDGGSDMDAIIAALLQQRQPNVGPLYNPLAPTSQPNPAYDPSLYGPQQAQPTVAGPSDLQAKQTAARAGMDPTNAYLQEADRQKAMADFYNARSKILKTHPLAQQNLPAETPLPALSQASIPQRSAPQLDPAAAVLSSLAGLVAPRFAGMFGVQPLQAGLQHADQEYQDRLRQYQQQQQQLMVQYEHDLAQHNETRKNALYGSEVDFNNRRQAVEDARQQALDALQGSLSATQAGNLSATGQAEQAAAGQRQTAADIGERIGYGLQQNASTIAAADTATKRENELLKTVLGVKEKAADRAASMQRTQLTTTAANQRAQLTQSGEMARTQYTQGQENARSAAGITSREKIAAQKQAVADLDTKDYTKADQRNISQWGQAYNKALSELGVAENQARRLYPQDAAAQARETSAARGRLAEVFASWQKARQEAEKNKRKSAATTAPGGGSNTPTVNPNVQRALQGVQRLGP